MIVATPVLAADEITFTDLEFSASESWQQTSDISSNIDEAGPIYPGVELSYDVEVSNSNFIGNLFVEGVMIFGEDWSTWIKKDDQMLLSASSFEGGKASIRVAYSASELPNASETFRQLVFVVVGQNSDFKGDVTISNINLINGDPDAQEEPGEILLETSGLVYDFGDVAFDPASGWDQREGSVSTQISGEIRKGASAAFNVNIDSAEFSGLIKAKAAVKIGSDWKWIDSSIRDLSASDFSQSEGVSPQALVTVSYDEAIEEFPDIKEIVFIVAGSSSDYSGPITISDLILTNGPSSSEPAPPLPEVESLVWDFDDESAGLGGWIINDGDRAYDYSGESSLEYDASTFDSPALRFNVDYSANSTSGWSEAKIYSTFWDSPISLSGYNELTYDFFYNPSYMTSGSWRSKLYFSEAANSFSDIPSSGEELANGFIKVPVSIRFSPAEEVANQFMLSIIGMTTDYKGPVYIDNVILSQRQSGEPGVLITETPETQAPIDISSLDIEDAVKLSDSDATDEAKNLYAYLKAAGKTEYVIFGHQNDTHHKAGGSYPGSTYSDSKDLTGSIAGVAGIDTLSLIGNEFPGKVSASDERYDADPVKGSANVSLDAAKNGAAITLSAHMPNFSLVYEKGKNSDGAWDFTGYTPNDISGNVMQRILPGGDLNEVFNAYLDVVSSYASILQEEGVPILFRPFHENNGGWFWWGAASSTPENFKSVFKYTVDYMKKKGIHNMLYVYSPNGPFSSAENYLERYPGDAYVDIIAFDYYQNGQTSEEATKAWISGAFASTVRLVEAVAEERGKLPAVSEMGIITGTSLNDGRNWGCIAETGNTHLDWFNSVLDEVSPSSMSYMLAWADFDTGNFDMTYRINETRGHEMSNSFIRFYNDPRSVFADGTSLNEALSREAPVSEEYGEESGEESGYILSPVDGTYILDEIQLIANIENAVDASAVSFAIIVNDGTELILPATSRDYYEALLTKEQVESFGSQTAAVKLLSGGAALGQINVTFGEKPVKPAGVVDDFELYNGSNDQLRAAWSANSGASCENVISLDEQEKSLNGYGMSFEYRISAPPEGYTGVTTQYTEDVSGYGALQLWIKPDGKGQKLVVQITSNGEDFEVDLRDFAATTEDKVVTIPFASLKGKNNGTFNPAGVSRVGLWCNTIAPDNSSWTVESVFYFDNIRFVESDATEITYEDLPKEEEPTPVPEEPTPAPEEPTPTPEEPTPTPEEPTPAPEEPTPAPEEPTPAPEEPSPASPSSGGAGNSSSSPIMPSASASVLVRGESHAITLGMYWGVNIPSDDLLSLKSPLTIEKDDFSISLSLDLLAELDLRAGSVIEAKLYPPDDSIAYKFSQNSKVDQKLFNQSRNISIWNGASYVSETEHPIKVAINAEGLSESQKSLLTGALFKPDGTIKKLGGKMSNDGKEFVFYTYEAGLHGLLQSDELKTLHFAIGTTAYLDNGNALESDAAPFILEDRAMVPIRVIAEALGATVGWNGETKTASVQKGSTTILMPIGAALPNGLGTAVIRNDRTFVPLRFVAEHLDANVVWNQEDSSIDIYQ
jgi:mannan endo-1,4-beta-mannosidase